MGDSTNKDYFLQQRHVKFLLCAIDRYQNGVRFHDVNGDNVELTDVERADIDEVFSRLIRHDWT